MIRTAAIGVPGSEIGLICGDQNHRCGDHGRSEEDACA